jgi:hypothetical protein
MKAYGVIGIVMTAGLQAQTHDCSVYVYVMRGAPMPGGMLLQAKSQAIQMFREIGVNVRMRNGIPAHDPSDACGAPIVVQFEEPGDYRGGPYMLARAYPYKKSGTCIHLFLDRVLQKLDQQSVLGNPLLAHVMVHEITHVLEGITRHSAEGVMKAVWSDQDYENMKHRPLPFAPEDVKLIRDGLARRGATE